METTQTASRRYFLAVDGLRLLASLNVVLFHLHGIGGLHDLGGKPLWLFQIIRGPAFHATIFFMLGGFIFTVKFADRAATFSSRAFLVKRFKELFPLHLITTLVMVALKYVQDIAAGSLDAGKIVASALVHLSLLWSFFPFGTYSLNRPSWALSAFFLCYVLFGPMLRMVVKIRRKRICMAAAICCMAPVALWSLLYISIGTPADLYNFFHIFAPVRFFEFAVGMLLARFFLLSSVCGRSEAPDRSLSGGLVNDAMILSAGALIYMLARYQASRNPAVAFFTYHVCMVPLYFVVLYSLATERGIVCRLLSLSVVRKTGRSSFYPYLIHIPLISTICYVCERGFGYYTFLHHTGSIAAFILILYGGSYFYVNHIRKRRPSGPPSRSSA